MVFAVAAGAWGYLRASRETERLTIERAVIRELHDNSNYSVAILDHEGRVVKWNAAMESLSGYTESEMLGRTLEHLMPPEQAKRHNEALMHSMEDEQSQTELRRVQCNLVKKDGTSIPVEVTVRVVQPVGLAPYSVAHVDLHKQIIDLPETPTTVGGGDP